MKTVALLALAALIALPVAAQNDSGVPTTSPGPAGPPAPNINAGGNPTAPSQQLRGGWPRRGRATGDDARRRRRRRERERSVAQPQEGARPSTPQSESPETLEPPNPGALQGGPQP